MKGKNTLKTSPKLTFGNSSPTPGSHQQTLAIHSPNGQVVRRLGQRNTCPYFPHWIFPTAPPQLPMMGKNVASTRSETPTKPKYVRPWSLDSNSRHRIVENSNCCFRCGPVRACGGRGINFPVLVAPSTPRDPKVHTLFLRFLPPRFLVFGFALEFPHFLGHSYFFSSSIRHWSTL